MFEPEIRGHAGMTSSAAAKFFIGLLAGMAAVLLPRLLALLARSDDAHIVFFPPSYFLLAAGVGVFLGLVMLVLEYQVAARPKETFMAALGIPAVLSGALGTASTAETVSDLTRDAERLREVVREEQRISKDGSFRTLERLGAPAPKPSDASSSLGISLVGIAHAQEARIGQNNGSDPLRFGVRLEQPKYVVVLKKSATAQAAVTDAQRLQADLPAARAMRSDRGYYVVLDNPPASETDALLAARQARKATNDAVQPRLIEVK
jgi:hypothetical protein